VVVCHPDSLATVDHEGLSMYCPTCVSLSSQSDLVSQLSQDLSSHTQSSTRISPFNSNVADSFSTHDSISTLELGSTSGNFLRSLAPTLFLTFPRSWAPPLLSSPIRRLPLGSLLALLVTLVSLLPLWQETSLVSISVHSFALRRAL